MTQWERRACCTAVAKATTQVMCDSFCASWHGADSFSSPIPPRNYTRRLCPPKEHKARPREWGFSFPGAGLKGAYLP